MKPAATPNWQDGADRRIWAIAGPAILAGSSTPLVGLVDTWAIGHLPSPVHLAAIGVAATVFTYVFWAFGFLRMGTTGFVAQAHGRGRSSELDRLMVRVMVTSLAIALLIIILAVPIKSGALAALTPPPEVVAPFTAYFDIRIWSAPATLMVYALNGFLIGTARAKTALLLQLLLNITNGALSLLFVLGLGMGVEGIALGTLIAEWLTFLIGMVIFLRLTGSLTFVRALQDRNTWHLPDFTMLFKVNSLLLVRTLLLMTALAMVTRTASTLGPAELAATHVLNTFLLLISLGLDGFAYAAEALTGAAYGAGNRAEFRFWVRRGFLWAFGASFFYVLLFGLGGNMITAVLTDLEPVRAIVREAGIMITVLPLVAVWCYQFDGIYIGATDARGMLVTMAAAFALFILAVTPMTQAWGFVGLWGAVILFMGLRGLGQLLLYPRLEAKVTKTL